MGRGGYMQARCCSGRRPTHSYHPPSHPQVLADTCKGDQYDQAYKNKLECAALM